MYEFIFTKLFPTEKEAHGIYYTPIFMVDFMLKSVEEVLRYHFNSSFNARGNYVLDPFAGTGSFITRLCSKDLNLIQKDNLSYKFSNELYAVELQPLAYYGCKLNVEQTINQRLGFSHNRLTNNHILLGDTFTMYERQISLKDGQQPTADDLLNRISIKQFNQVPINIVITNPP